MQLVLEVPDRLKRKLKALLALAGDDLGDFDEFILGRIETIVDAQILRELGQEGFTPQFAAHVSKRPAFVRPNLNGDSFDVGAGLSSESIPDDDIPAAPAVSREMIERDSQVQDPKKEAVSPDNEEVSFEDFLGLSELSADSVDASDDNPFHEALNQPLPVIEDTPPQRQNVRRLPKDCRAKVSSATDAGETERNSF